MAVRIRGYNTFGFREVWIEEYLYKGLDYLLSHLGSCQSTAITKWLYDAGLLDYQRKRTKCIDILVRYYRDFAEIYTFIIVNLYYGSKLFEFYCEMFVVGRTTICSSLTDSLITLTGCSFRTALNLRSSLYNSLKSYRSISLQNAQMIEFSGNRIQSITRKAIEGIQFDHIVYLLYEIQAQEGRSVFQLDEYPLEYGSCSIRKLFGIDSHCIFDILFRSESFHKDLIKGYDTSSVEIYGGVSSLEALGLLARNKEGL